jgi:hypothetical protein
VLPLDEGYDTLYRTSTGWELHFLDGTVQLFDDDGLWIKTVDRNGNETNTFYASGKLERIELPDGRDELSPTTAPAGCWRRQPSAASGSAAAAPSPRVAAPVLTLGTGSISWRSSDPTVRSGGWGALELPANTRR